MEFASAKQTLQLASDPANVIWRLDNINLSSFDRLVNIARNYQYFRFTKVEVKIKPFTDTFPTGVSSSVPYLYWLINKGDSLDFATFNQLRDAGAKPIRFDEKTITVRWKPAISVGVAANQPVAGPPTGTAFSRAVVSPWLSTDVAPLDVSTVWAPSTVPHKGIFYAVEQDITGGNTLYYNVEITVYAQFKKPLGFAPEAGVIESKQKSLDGLGADGADDAPAPPSMLS